MPTPRATDGPAPSPAIRMGPVLTAVLGSVLAAAAAHGADRPVPIAPANVAEEMPAACFDCAVQVKLPSLAVAVVDAGGALVGFRRQPGAPTVVGEAAILKAQSAARTRSATVELAQHTQDPAVRDANAELQVTTRPGGIPLLDGESLLGSVGVSGAQTAQDAECARRAVEARGTAGAKPAPPDTALGMIARQKLAQFERDFNRGAVSPLMAQYDPQFIGILGAELLDYTQYIAKVREQLAAPARPPFRIEVHEVRVLDPTHVLANGFTYSGSPHQGTDRSPFTVIYARFGTAWRLVYSHSPD